MANFTCPIGSSTHYGFNTATAPSVAPTLLPTPASVIDSPSIAQVAGAVALVGIAGFAVRHCYDMEQEAERERAGRAGGLLIDGAAHIAAGAIDAGLRVAVPIVTDLAGRAFNAAWNGIAGWWNRPAPAIAAERVAAVIPAAQPQAQPAANPVAEAIPVDAGAGREAMPEAVPAADLAAQAAAAEVRFTEAATRFVSEIDFRTITPQIYSAFITEQRNTNDQVPLERMHAIIAEIFAENKSYEIPVFITEMRDHTTLDAEIAATAASAAARRARLLAQEARLAGEGRFDGYVDDAWAGYFTAAIQQTAALARLCHFMVGHGAELTPHENRMLFSVLHPKHPTGALELNAMHSGLKLMACGNSNISITDLIDRARRMPGAADLIQSLQAASRETTRTFTIYSTRHSDRVEIAGEGVNPHREVAAAGSAIARTADEVTSAEATRARTIARREAQIALVERFEAGTQGEIYIAPNDRIGGL